MAVTQKQAVAAALKRTAAKKAAATRPGNTVPGRPGLRVNTGPARRSSSGTGESLGDQRDRLRTWGQSSDLDKSRGKRGQLPDSVAAKAQRDRQAARDRAERNKQSRTKRAI